MSFQLYETPNPITATLSKNKHKKTQDSHIFININGEKCLAFFSKKSLLSNFYSKNFEINRIIYSSVEQYYFTQKASFFCDFYVKSEILKTEIHQK